MHFLPQQCDKDKGKMPEIWVLNHYVIEHISIFIIPQLANNDLMTNDLMTQGKQNRPDLLQSPGPMTDPVFFLQRQFGHGFPPVRQVKNGVIAESL